MSDRLEAGHGVLVTVDGKRSQPDLPNDADFVAHLNRDDVSVHLSQNWGADGALVNHGGINAGDIANTDVVDILVGLGGVALPTLGDMGALDVQTFKRFLIMFGGVVGKLLICGGF